MGAQQRLHLFDSGQYEKVRCRMSRRILKFRDGKRYTDHIKASRRHRPR
jgi:acetyl-CoA carboxylase beta subunit